MMKRIVSASLAMMLCAAAWGQEQGDVKQAIIGKANQIDQSLTKQDKAAFERLVPASWKGIQPNGQMQTRDQLAQSIFDKKTMQMNSIQRSDETVQLVDNTAVQTAVLDIQGNENGKEFSNKYAVTNVWVKRDGEWQVLSSQMTPVHPRRDIAMAGPIIEAEPAAAREESRGETVAQMYQRMAQNDVKRIEGRWQLDKAVVDGKDVPQEQVRTTVLVTKGNNFSFPQSTEVGTAPKGTFTVNPMTDPKQIDAIAGAGPNQGKVSLGIYKIEGDTQTEAFSPPGMPRPTSFESTPGSNVTYQVWKRAGQ